MPISLSGSLNLSGSLTTTGTITATTLVVQTITSSISSITGSTNFGSLSSNNHVFTGSLNVTGALYIATGSVGIGTVSPSQLFEVVGGEIKAGRVDSSNEGGQISFGRSTDNATAWYIDAYGNVASPQLRFVNVTNAVVAMTITGSNVGIGTSTPAYTLDVSGTGRFTGALRVDHSTAGAYGAIIYNTSATGQGLTIRGGSTASHSALVVQPYDGSITLLNILSTGPATFSSTLSAGIITGDGGSTGTAGIVAKTGGGGNSGTYGFGGNTDYLIKGGSDYANMQFVAGGSGNTRMTIQGSTGDVYIGTTTLNKDGRLVVYGETTTASYYAIRAYSVGSDVLFGVRNDGALISGTLTNSPYNLVRSGRVMMVDVSGVIGYQSSTRESKTNINNLTDISFLYQLNPVSFNYRKTEEISNTFTDEYNEDLHYGLIADEVEKVNKELVFYNEKNGQKEVAGVEYGKLTAVLVKAIQELTARVQYLENK
jgi:hypothetical protein